MTRTTTGPIDLIRKVNVEGNPGAVSGNPGVVTGGGCLPAGRAPPPPTLGSGGGSEVRRAPPPPTADKDPEPQVELGDQTSETVGRVPVVPPPSSPNRSFPPVFDSHFHLDRLGSALRRRGAKVSTSTSGRAPRVPVSVVGGIANYCDPITFGQVNWSLRPGFGVAVGIHPKHAPVSPSNWAEFIRLVCDPRVQSPCTSHQ